MIIAPLSGAQHRINLKHQNCQIDLNEEKGCLLAPLFFGFELKKNCQRYYHFPTGRGCVKTQIPKIRVVNCCQFAWFFSSNLG